MENLEDLKVGIIGLGYVGLPLAVEFSKYRDIVAFDIEKERIAQLKNGIDVTGEVSSEELYRSKRLSFTNEKEKLHNCNFFCICVPTPVDEFRRPDLSALINATEMVATLLSGGDIVVYESTVYPGCTEEVCAPILERISGLEYLNETSYSNNSEEGFFLGYSPERVNPGDKNHKLPFIKKITSGSTKEAANTIDGLYSQVIQAGTHMAEGIKVAEAAKVIENTQRDLNIALVNELAILFDLLEIDSNEVLRAAGTKWNFLPFRPGLVGGHCIGVDPYYLTHKAQAVGYHPELILAGRRINDGMGHYVALQLVKAMNRKGVKLAGSKVLILGLTFKENCPDLRNTRVVDIVYSLQDFMCDVEIFDPRVDREEAVKKYNVNIVSSLTPSHYDGVVIAVPHDEIVEMGAESIRNLCSESGVVYDVKCIFDRDQTDLRL
jgi:nucleotide sugar dehydrogenase